MTWTTQDADMTVHWSGRGAGHAARWMGSELLFLDFKNGNYRIRGAPCAIADALVQDLNWGQWSASNVVAGTGLNGGATTNPTLTANAVSALTSGFSFLITWTNSASPGQGSIDLYNAAYDHWLTANYVNTASAPFLKDQTAASTNVGSASGLGRHKASGTVSTSLLGMSIDAGAAVSYDPPAGTNALTSVSFWLGTAGNYIESISFTRPQAAALLPGMSS